MAGSGFAYRGDVLARVIVNGVPNPVITELKAVTFETAIVSELAKRKGHGRQDAGLTTGSFSKITDSTVKFTIGEQSGDVMEFLMLATKTALNIAGGTVAAETFTVVLDRWVALDFDNISSPVIAGSAVDVDFIIDPEGGEEGMIMCLSTGNLVEGATPSLAYTYGTITGDRYEAGTVPQVDLLIKFKGISMEDGSKVGFRIPKLSVEGGATIQHISDEEYFFPESNAVMVKLDTEPGVLIYDSGVVYG